MPWYAWQGLTQRAMSNALENIVSLVIFLETLVMITIRKLDLDLNFTMFEYQSVSCKRWMILGIYNV